MLLRHFQSEVWLPRSRGEIFPFFGDAGNLDALTPAWLHFHIRTPLPIKMEVGTHIQYQIRIHGIPVRWTTEITAWEPPYQFVDRQLCGPYRQWVHTHTFEDRDGGTLCRDHVAYAHWGGELVHRWFVRPDLERIFQYRSDQLQVFLGQNELPG